MACVELVHDDDDEKESSGYLIGLGIKANHRYSQSTKVLSLLVSSFLYGHKLIVNIVFYVVFAGCM